MAALGLALKGHAKLVVSSAGIKTLPVVIKHLAVFP